MYFFLQYLQDCDSVAVMMNGRIKEQGSHSELMSKKGEYARLITTHCTYLEDILEEEDEEEDDEDEIFSSRTRKQSVSIRYIIDAILYSNWGIDKYFISH